MNGALLAARLLLAAVFVVAGVGKLFDLDASIAAAGDFGVPDRFSRAVGMGLPIVELTVAAALLPRATTSAAALAAAILLGTFIAGIARAMARGEQPDCHCFGQIHSAPVGRGLLARNLGLLGVAIFVAIAGWGNAGSSATAWIGRLHGVAIAVAVMGVALVLVGWFSFELLRQQGRLLMRIEYLEDHLSDTASLNGHANGGSTQHIAPGTDLSDVQLSSAHGEILRVRDLIHDGADLMTLFVAPECGPCVALLPRIAEWQRNPPHDLAIAVVSSGDPDRVAQLAGEYGLAHGVIPGEPGATSDLRLLGTPSAMLVSDAGRLLKPIVAGAPAIEALFNERRGPATTPSVGPGSADLVVETIGPRP